MPAENYCNKCENVSEKNWNPKGEKIVFPIFHFREEIELNLWGHCYVKHVNFPCFALNSNRFHWNLINPTPTIQWQNRYLVCDYSSVADFHSDFLYVCVANEMILHTKTGIISLRADKTKNSQETYLVINRHFELKIEIGCAIGLWLLWAFSRKNWKMNWNRSYKWT